MIRLGFRNRQQLARQYLREEVAIVMDITYYVVYIIAHFCDFVKRFYAFACNFAVGYTYI